MKLLRFPCVVVVALAALCAGCDRRFGASVPGSPAGAITPLDDARAPMPDPQALAVPQAFQGEWATRAAQCGRQDEGHLQIAADQVRFSESHGVIVGATVEDGTLELQIQLEGQGQTSQAQYRFALSDTGHALIDVTDGPGLRRVRCAG
ncbi:MAG: hypothetical protein ABW178_01765 [Pseudoxanthomonas sp.]